MNNILFKFISALLSICLVCFCCGCCKDSGTASSGRRENQEIIEEIAVYYGTYGDKAGKTLAEKLDELEANDSGVAAKWRSVVALWKNSNNDLRLHYDVLPDGLPETDELCLVVLGFQLNPDGTMRDELLERLKVAKASAEKYPDSFVVCTGGGTASDNKDMTEAGAMAAWLIENGISKDRVIVEDKSITTAQNAMFTLDILGERYPQVNKLAIISSDYHIATGHLLFGAESTLRAEAVGKEKYEVISNAAWKAPSGSLSTMFQAGALIELSGDKETAWKIYYDEYDIHELPPLS